MPAMNPGAPRKSILPIYLAIRDIGGELIEQPPNSPTIEIVYVDPESHMRVNSVEMILMDEIEPGLYFYLWHIAEDEQLGLHDLILRGVIDDISMTASDQSFEETYNLQNPTFVVKVDVIEEKDIIYPSTLNFYPQKAKAQPCHGANAGRDREADIGLNDRVLDGAFRFGQYPDQVVDRRILGRFQVSLIDPRTRFGSRTVGSEMPGGGPAIRPQAPPGRRTRYDNGFRY